MPYSGASNSRDSSAKPADDRVPKRAAPAGGIGRHEWRMTDESSVQPTSVESQNLSHTSDRRIVITRTIRLGGVA